MAFLPSVEWSDLQICKRKHLVQYFTIAIKKKTN
jgi:hypothetical protein